jgi:hypothetical protein
MLVVWQVCEGKETHTGFWLGKIKERGHLHDLGVDGKIIQGILNKYDGRVWGKLMWLRTQASVGSLRTLQ